MWQTGRKASRARVGDANELPSASVSVRRASLPPLEPAPLPAAERFRALCVRVAGGARRALLALALGTSAWALFQSNLPDRLGFLRTAGFWAQFVAGLAAVFLVLHLRGQIGVFVSRHVGQRRNRHDPYARFAAEARAARAPRR